VIVHGVTRVTIRSPSSGYRREMDDTAQLRMLTDLRGLKSMVALSGYASDLYERELIGWSQLTKNTADLAGNKRQEVLWLSSAAQAARAGKRLI
jgi:DNA adenine methylase